jgi:hypothetical protein
VIDGQALAQAVDPAHGGLAPTPPVGGWAPTPGRKHAHSAASDTTNRLNRRPPPYHAPVVNVQPEPDILPDEPTPPAAVLASPTPKPPPAAVVEPASDNELGFGPEAESAPSGGGDELGFGDDGGAARTAAAAPSEPSKWSLEGAIRELTAIRTERDVVARLASLRMLLDLKLNYSDDFVLLGAASSFRVVASGRAEYDFALLAKQLYDAPTREAYLWQVIPQDTYAALNIGVLSLSFGKQIVVFGQGEALSALDVVNPRDLREPVLTDPSDMRLAVLMSRLGLRLGPVQIEGLVVHEANPGLFAPPLGEWNPIRKLMLDSASLSDSLQGHELRWDHRPEAALWRASSMQYHGRITFQGSGYELSLQAASLLDMLGVSSLPMAEDLLEHRIDLDLFHPRYTMLGQSGAFTVGSFVVRWELAVDLDRLASVRRIDTNLLRLDSARFTQLHSMVGLSWVPDSSTNASLEWLQGFVPNDPTRRRLPGQAPTALLWPIETPQFALRVTHTFLDERASFNALLVLIGIYPFNAFAGKFDIAYKVYGSLQLTVGYAIYHGSLNFGPLYGFGKNDRLLFGLRWDFAVH